MTLKLHTHVRHAGLDRPALFKVLDAPEAAVGAWPAEQVLLWAPGGAPGFAGRAAGLYVPDGDAIPEGAGFWAGFPADKAVIQPGDVIRLRSDSSQVSVLYRRGSRNNTLFATERCNCACLMCSQPPREEDDQWRVAENLALVELVDRSEPQLGISGGEPTLLGDGLIAIVRRCRDLLPATRMHILTNGRRFADPQFADAVARVGHPSCMWAVPLYADTPDQHDHVVQAPGAFDETLHGLYQMAVRRMDVEIRVVLHKLTVDRLDRLADFIQRNLPFARHVALMGLEPMGYARGNRDQLWIDPLDYQDALARACHHLDNAGLATSIYNLPLCVLPQDLWRFARQSISDWKNIYAPECAGCAVVDRCAGFFTSAGPAWRSRGIGAIAAGTVPLIYDEQECVA